MPSLSKCRIIDVGCGISSVLHFIPGERYGIDPLAEYYKLYYQYPEGIKISRGYGEDIPYQENFFDVAFCSNVIDHVQEPDKTISEIYRVLKPAGQLVLTVECFDKTLKRDPAHPWSLTVEDVEKLLNQFRVKFKKNSPWIGLKAYADGIKVSTGKNLEYIYLCESKKLAVTTKRAVAQTRFLKPAQKISD